MRIQKYYSENSSNTFHHLPVLLILLFIINFSTATNIKSLYSTCLCDISDTCDDQCCCDSDCSSKFITQLTAFGRCQSNGFGIPFCANMTWTDVNQNDLFSGLKTIYTIVKRLFCLQRINIVNPTTFYNKNSAESIQTSSIQTIDSNINSQTTLPANIASLSTASIPLLFYRSQSGTCETLNQISKNIGTNGYQQCRAFLNSAASIGDDPILSTNNAINKTIFSTYPNIPIYRMTESTQVNPTKQSNATTSCNATMCQNVLRFLKLYINPQTNEISQSVSFAVVSNLELSFIQPPAYITVKYDYEYLNKDGSFANASNVGYNMGSLLQLMKKGNDSNYYKVANPINLAFRTPSGACRSANQAEADESLIQLRLGRSQYYSCAGSSDLLVDSITNAFDYVGKMGASNNKLQDFISISWPSSTSNSDITLTFEYTKVGSQVNPQYYILNTKAVIKAASGSQNILFVQYQEVENTATMYLPPPPKIHAYLPNDFLYPFYVAQ